MSMIQPGSGYGFTSGGYGFTLNTENPFASETDSNPRHPFKLVNVGIYTTGGSKSVRFQVVSGTMNNLVPNMLNYSTGTKVKLDRVTSGVADPPTFELSSIDYEATAKTTYICLRAGASTTTGEYPNSDIASTRYPYIIPANEAAPPDEDTWAFLVIGSITVDSITAPNTFSVNQNITGSIWADRLKVGTDTARYYYARI